MTAAFDPADHPRGRPGNAGQFAGKPRPAVSAAAAAQLRAVAAAAPLHRDSRPWVGRHDPPEPPPGTPPTQDDAERLRSGLVGAHPGLRLWLTAKPWGVALDEIRVPGDARRAGTGTAVMESLCAEADRRGWTVACTPSTDFGGTKAGLDRFYRRFGFRPQRGRRPEISETWVRDPDA